MLIDSMLNASDDADGDDTDGDNANCKEQELKLPPMAPPMWFRNKVTREEFAAESDQVK